MIAHATSAARQPGFTRPSRGFRVPRETPLPWYNAVCGRTFARLRPSCGRLGRGGSLFATFHVHELRVVSHQESAAQERNAARLRCRAASGDGGN
jgi:hypothetical protein